MLLKGNFTSTVVHPLQCCFYSNSFWSRKFKTQSLSIDCNNIILVIFVVRTIYIRWCCIVRKIVTKVVATCVNSTQNNSTHNFHSATTIWETLHTQLLNWNSWQVVTNVLLMNRNSGVENHDQKLFCFSLILTRKNVSFDQLWNDQWIEITINLL